MIIPNSWIVTLYDHVTTEESETHREWASEVQRDHLGDQGRESGADIITHTYQRGMIKGYAGIFHEDTIQQIRDHEHVSHVEPNREMITCAQITQSPIPSWGLGSISHRSGTGLTYPYDVLEKQGREVFVYVIDSGVRVSHTEFDSGRASHAPNIAGSSTDDQFGHGTVVAGIIAGKTCGIAKSAKIISVKVYQDIDRLESIDVIAAVEWVIEDVLAHDRVGRAVVNISLTTRDAGTVYQLNAQVNEGSAHGIVFVAAAGNHNLASAASPASAYGAVSVGATRRVVRDGEVDELYRWENSNFGASINIFAPGADIISCSNTGDQAFAVGRGTSVAAPHVAGVIAYLMSLHDEWTPAKVTAYLLRIASHDLIGGLDVYTPNLFLYNGSGK